MKRCPQCQFIYVDTDVTCDFDGTPLVTANEQELNLSPTARRSGLWLTRIIASLAAVIAGLALIFAYHQNRQSRLATVSQQPPMEAASPVLTPTPSPSIETVAASPTLELKEHEAASPKPAANSSGAVSRNPVSTTGKAERGAATLWLQNGSRIDVDEVWRTKQGIWYRRQGVVTLIKASSVKTIQRKTKVIDD